MGFPMRGAVTATGTTSEVAVPTLRRDKAENGQEHKCGPRKSEQFQACLKMPRSARFLGRDAEIC